LIHARLRLYYHSEKDETSRGNTKENWGGKIWKFESLSIVCDLVFEICQDFDISISNLIEWW
jgi:hypothetical protein